MTWEVVVTDEFAGWFGALAEPDRARLTDRIDLLEQEGPALGRSVVDSIKASRHRNMKELRSGTLRVLFAFDPESAALLLIGGDKRSDWASWYDRFIPLADDLFDKHLNEIQTGEGR